MLAIVASVTAVYERCAAPGSGRSATVEKSDTAIREPVFLSALVNARNALRTGGAYCAPIDADSSRITSTSSPQDRGRSGFAIGRVSSPGAASTGATMSSESASVTAPYSARMADEQTPRADGRQRLIEAAERLIATRGMGVSSQEIIAAAEHRNRSAIQYHFGSRDALVEAVRKARGTRIAAYRLQLMSRLPEPGKRTTAELVEAYLRPLVAEIQSESPSYWARFCEMFLLDQPLMLIKPDGSPIDDRSQNPPGPIASGLYAELVRHLSAQMPAEEATGRVSLTVRFLVSSLARWERDSADDPTCVAPLSVFSIILTDIAVSMLDAPSRIPDEVHARLVDGHAPASA